MDFESERDLMNKKKTLEVVILLVIGAAFVSSYAISFSGIGTTRVSSTTTTVAPSTTYAYGFANAMILNFSNDLQVSPICNDSAGTINEVSNLTLKLEANGSVTNEYSLGSGIDIQTGTMNAGEFYGYASNMLSSNAIKCVEFSGTAFVELPQTINFTISGQKYPLGLSQAMRDYQIPINLSYTGNVILLRVSGLVEGNGTVYQINVSRG